MKNSKCLMFALLLLPTGQAAALDEIAVPGVAGEYRFEWESHEDVQQTRGYYYKNFLNLRSQDWKREFTWELTGELRNNFNLGSAGSTYHFEKEDKIDTAYIRWAPEEETRFTILGGRQHLTHDYLVNFDGVAVNGFPHKSIDVGIFGGRKVQPYEYFQEDNIFGGELGLHFDLVDFRYNVRKDLDKIFHVLNMNFYPMENFTLLVKEEIFDDRQEYFQLGFDYINPEWDFTIHDLFTQRNIAGSRVVTALGNDAFPAYRPYGFSDELLYANDSQSNFFMVTKQWEDKFETGSQWELLLDDGRTNYWAQWFVTIFDLFTDGSQFTLDINKTSNEWAVDEQNLNAGFEYRFPFRVHWLFNFGYIQDILDTTADSYKWGRYFGGLQYKRNKDYLFKLQVTNHNGDIINNGLVRNLAATRNDNQLNFDASMKF